MFSSSKFEIDLYLCWIRLLYSCNIYLFFVIILVKFNAHSLVMSPLEALASNHCPHYRCFFRLQKTYFNAPPKLLIFSVDFLFFFKNAIKHYCFSAFYFIFINWLHVWCIQDKLFCLFCQNLIKCPFIISSLNCMYKKWRLSYISHKDSAIL